MEGMLTPSRKNLKRLRHEESFARDRTEIYIRQYHYRGQKAEAREAYA